MKITTNVEDTFKPVTFTITIESKEELMALAANFNLSVSKLTEEMLYLFKSPPPVPYNFNIDLYYAVNDVVEKYKIPKKY